MSYKIKQGGKWITVAAGTNGGGAEAQDPLTETTWAELKDLRDAGKLTAGMQYRITDFVTTTTQAETQSAGHPFDLIVTADSASRLNEKARAILHEGDEYFADSKLNAWQIWYSLDNDTARFAWADSDGKGVIYRMVDEFRNDLPYDFKNVQFKRYKITAVTDSKKPDGLVNGYFGARQVGGSAMYPSGYTISTEDTAWRYTFDYSGADYSLNKYASGSGGEWAKNCYGNGIAACFLTGGSGGRAQVLNNAAFLNTSALAANYANRLTGAQTHTVTFGNGCYNNTLGNNCNYNTLGNGCYYNTLGNNCNYNTLGNNCNYNTLGNSCYYNTLGNYCRSNTLGNNCDSNTLGNGCDSNTLGNYCDSNTLGNRCGSNEGANVFDGSFRNKRFDLVSLYFDSSDSSAFALRFKNDSAQAVRVTGLYDAGEYSDYNGKSPTPPLDVTVQPGTEAALFSYDDGSLGDGYSVWEVAYTVQNVTVHNNDYYD